jgi:hypothetical protein
LILTAAASLCWFHLQAADSLPYGTHHQSFALDEDVVTDDTFKLDDLLLQNIVQQCMQQQDTFIWLQQQGGGRKGVAVQDDHQLHLRPGAVDGSCGLFHIPLASSDRSIGLCTDAALYVQLLGGWIAPATDHGLQHAQGCGHKSAVLFLEPLYEPWLSWLEQQQHMVAVYAPNFEQVFEYDSAAHKRMRMVLCKVHRCHELMDRYLDSIRSTATLIYTGEPFWECGHGYLHRLLAVRSLRRRRLGSAGAKHAVAAAQWQLCSRSIEHVMSAAWLYYAFVSHPAHACNRLLQATHLLTPSPYFNNSQPPRRQVLLLLLPTAVTAGMRTQQHSSRRTAGSHKPALWNTRALPASTADSQQQCSRCPCCM